jgi:hypothetical protein
MESAAASECLVPLRALQSAELEWLRTTGVAASIVVPYCTFDVAPLLEPPHVVALLVAAVAAAVLPLPLNVAAIVAVVVLTGVTVLAARERLAVSRHRPGERVAFARTLDVALRVVGATQDDAIVLRAVDVALMHDAYDAGLANQRHA